MTVEAMKKSMNQLLAGKCCLITSGAHGLGLAIAILFARHGAAIAICGRGARADNSVALLQQYSPQSFYSPCDLSDPEQVERFADTVLTRFSHVDILVNNGGVNIREHIHELQATSFDRIHQINLRAAVQLTRRICTVMREQKIRGSIVNIASMNAISPACATISYSTSKGGLLGFSRALACDLGIYQIRSNAICPGWIATTYIQHDVETCVLSGGSSAQELQKYENSSPLLGPGRPADIANHALFFASDLSSYITGAVICSDGGAVVQAHRCEFPVPPDYAQLRQAYYDSIVNDPSWI